MKSLAIDSGKLEVSDINLECEFKCTGMELFNALTQPEMIQVFTQNPRHFKSIGNFHILRQ